MQGENKSLVVHVASTQEFEAVIAKGGVVLVDFFADRCGPCKALAPIMEEIAEEYAGDVTVVKVDVDEVNEVAAQYGVMSIPTVYVFHNGQKHGEPIIGAHPKDNYTDIIESLTE